MKSGIEWVILAGSSLLLVESGFYGHSGCPRRAQRAIFSMILVRWRLKPRKIFWPAGAYGSWGLGKGHLLVQQAGLWRVDLLT